MKHDDSDVQVRQHARRDPSIAGAIIVAAVAASTLVWQWTLQDQFAIDDAVLGLILCGCLAILIRFARRSTNASGNSKVDATLVSAGSDRDCQSEAESRQGRLITTCGEHHLSRIIDASPSAMILIDDSGSMVFVNAQAEHMFGYSRGDLIGRDVDLLVPEGCRQIHRIHWEEYSRSPHPRTMGAGMDLVGVRKDGVEVPLEVGLNPIEMDGRTFVLAAIVDVSLRREREGAIQKMNDELRRKNAEMDLFVYTVSHALKSPVITIEGFIDVLADDVAHGNSTRAVETINRIRHRADHIHRTIDGLLNLSRVGRVAQEPVTTNCDLLIRQIVDDLSLQIDAAGATVDLESSFPCLIVDPVRIREVFENLIGNAIKYGCTSEHPVVRILSRVVEDEVRFVVEDNGVGIAPSHHSRVFDLFERLDRNHEGTGIGLAVVKRFVEVSGGRVWVESEHGQGAQFWVAFPSSMIASVDEQRLAQ